MMKNETLLTYLGSLVVLLMFAALYVFDENGKAEAAKRQEFAKRVEAGQAVVLAQCLVYQQCATNSKEP